MVLLRHHHHRSFVSQAARSSGAPPAVGRRTATPMPLCLLRNPPAPPPNPMVSNHQATAGQICVWQVRIVGFVVVITEAIKENYEHSRTPVLLSDEGTSFDADDWVS